MTREELEEIQALERKIEGLTTCINLIDEEDTWIEIRRYQHQIPVSRAFPDQADFKEAVKKVFESKIEFAKKRIDEMEKSSNEKPSVIYMTVHEDNTQSNSSLKDGDKRYVPKSSFWILTISVSILWILVGCLFICIIK